MKKILRVLLALILVLLVASAIYLLPHRCTDTNALESTDSVTVTVNGDTCFFDGAGENELLIFYPGGKVEYTAYCELMKEIAARGVDCCVFRVPLNLAFTAVDKAGSIIESCSYDKIYLGGHSLGGVAAAMYASEHLDALDGIVFLASYPHDDLSETSLRVLSIKGDIDGLVSAEAIDDTISLLPENSEYVIIKGGNHAQFGNYGNQSGDNDAAISPEAQKELAAEAIANFILEK